jgi:hypothetical protein
LRLSRSDVKHNKKKREITIGDGFDLRQPVRSLANPPIGLGKSVEGLRTSVFGNGLSVMGGTLGPSIL